MSITILQFSDDITIVAILGAEPEGEVILTTVDDIDTPVPLVAHASIVRFQVNFQCTQLNSVEQFVRRKAHLRISHGAPANRLVHILLEGTVANQLRIESAIPRMVYLLIEDTIMVFRDKVTTIVQVKFKFNLSLHGCNAERKKEQAHKPMAYTCDS